MEINASTYQTIASNCDGIFKDKGSKFLAFAYPVKTAEEIKKILENIKKEYFDARHHCYAYRLGAEKKIYRANDDGEPSGTAGKPIFGQIQSFDLTNILVVVVRYFGGTLLGTSGLINAYKQATANALTNAQIATCFIKSVYKCTFNYPEINLVMKTIKDFDVVTENQNFELNCSVILKIKKEYLNKVVTILEGINTLTLEYLYDE